VVMGVDNPTVFSLQYVHECLSGSFQRHPDYREGMTINLADQPFG
jgi:hypothetical protein